MPTTKPLHAITETGEVAAALAAAARRWPADAGRPSRLLSRLIETGRRSIEAEAALEVAERRGAVRRASGALTGVYSADEADALRDEWPA